MFSGVIFGMRFFWFCFGGWFFGAYCGGRFFGHLLGATLLAIFGAICGVFFCFDWEVMDDCFGRV